MAARGGGRRPPVWDGETDGVTATDPALEQPENALLRQEIALLFGQVGEQGFN